MKTEFTFFGEDSPYIDKDHRIELSIEDFISLVRKANEPNVTPEQIVDPDWESGLWSPVLLAPTVARESD